MVCASVLDVTRISNTTPGAFEDGPFLAPWSDEEINFEATEESCALNIGMSYVDIKGKFCPAGAADLDLAIVQTCTNSD